MVPLPKLYTVYCKCFTVHPPAVFQHSFPHILTQYFSIQLFHTFFYKVFQLIFPPKFPTNFSTQLFHTIFPQNCSPNFSTNFPFTFFYPIRPHNVLHNLSTLFFTQFVYLREWLKIKHIFLSTFCG